MRRITCFYLAATGLLYGQGGRPVDPSKGQALIDGRQNGWTNQRMFQPEFERKVTYL